MFVYRIQPQNADLHGIQTETSNGELACGVHVFESLEEAYGCREWNLKTADVELATIKCISSDTTANGDYEGVTLKAGCGHIVERRPFQVLSDLVEWLESQM